MPDVVVSKPIRKLLVANRSEIAIRVFRSAHELGVRTVAIYSHEDRFALHRFKADEAYEIGKPGEPIRAYLDIQGIVTLAKSIGVDAIHPGYGFLSESAAFARACGEAGIAFVGPRPEILDQLGDKVAARRIAQIAKVPILSGSDAPVKEKYEAYEIAKKLGYPVMVKAAMGGGGRGMRPVFTQDQLEPALEEARREAGTAFGVSDVFLEKLVRRARHIEVQLIGDQHGNLVHLYERDCSLQRRHQKICEIAPSQNLSEETRQKILDAALAVGRSVRLDNAGTVEFLVDAETGEFYFIEVNPRIQVEHTVTETITGYDIVKSQILIAQGTPLGDPEIGLGDQKLITARGFAIQARVTTEDPANGFVPDYGRLAHYRSASGVGIRLDAGTAFSGAVITPFYDSLLVKVTASGLRFVDAARRMERCLQEFRIRGVKTNIPFLLNLVNNPEFLEGRVTTRFLDETPALFQFSTRRDRASKLLSYIGEIIVNGHPEVRNAEPRKTKPVIPTAARPPQAAIPPGTRDKLKELGPDKFSRWLRKQKKLFITDTTMRDAHQSLFATRMRTSDMTSIAPRYARVHADFFSLEMWGGATFDTSMRFLKESPWDRLSQLRKLVPNVLFQMLLRAANAVGYTNYPDNVVQSFVKESAQAGIDVFRIFDSLNWLPNLKPAIDAVRQTDSLCEAAICYSGDILDPKRDKYTLKYFVKLAKDLEKLGTHILAIKDMAGLLKPYAARKLAFVEAMRFSDRDTGMVFDDLQTTADYWEEVRKKYAPFETGQKSSSSEVYLHEMPGGQYANLFQQAISLGVGDRWHEVGRTYAAVNQLFGDIVKVTPSSKVVGDMALFMLANNLSAEQVLDPQRELAFPESVVEFFEGKLGQPPGGFPPALQKKILRGRSAFTDRPGSNLAPANFAKAKEEVEAKIQRPVNEQETVTYLLYPRVFTDFAAHQRQYSDTSILPTEVFFYGMQPGDETSVDIEPGKTLIIKFLTIGDPHEDCRRLVFFELNGQPREVLILDKKLAGQGVVRSKPKAEAGNPLHVAAPMPGAVVAVVVAVGEAVAVGQKLLTMEAMKMETTLYAERAGRIAEVLTRAGTQVEGGDLLIRFEA
ncbi:MAG: pyruvate carboxylase [Planctomycetes bacterium]|nr:pyruvate carboxylase [Planctomycetota bacterium]